MILKTLALGSALLALAASATARSRQDIIAHQLQTRRSLVPANLEADTEFLLRKRMTGANAHMFQNPKAAQYYVDGKTIPEVDFDVGPSWAGLMPISNKKNETRKLFFWYYPLRLTLQPKRMTLCSSGQMVRELDGNLVPYSTLKVKITGGPGCSSLEGIAQENGPWTWPWGTYKPVENEWSWTNLSHVLWVEQPVGTGYSQGKPNLRDEVDLSAQLVGFFEQFLEVFSELKGKDLYLTGESYAGKYLPYIGDYIFTNATALPLKLKGLLAFDPSLASDVVQEDIPALPMVKAFENVFSLNASYMEELQTMSDKCGYTDYSKKYLSYPPNGSLPLPGDLRQRLRGVTFAAFNVYRIFDVWPILWDILGFPGSFPNEQSKPLYFDRTDVKKTLHISPNITWEECSSDNVFPNGDGSPDSAYGPLPRVIEKSERVVIGHGLADYVLIAEGTRIVLQNMTWNGMQGFQTAPVTDSFIVDGYGSVGTVQTERKLTYAEIKNSGHMVPQFVPWAGFKMVQFLLGHIDSL